MGARRWRLQCDCVIGWESESRLWGLRSEVWSERCCLLAGVECCRQQAENSPEFGRTQQPDAPGDLQQQYRDDA
eukprot:1107176-Rhodomonas_salina.8